MFFLMQFLLVISTHRILKRHLGRPTAALLLALGGLRSH
jgi:hypothetical protein